MITLAKLTEVKEEMARLQKAIDTLTAQEVVHELRHGGQDMVFHSSPRETGAIKRASMDLTRALARLRKPN